MNLKRANTIIELYGFLFIIMGPIFIGMGYFNKIGMLPTTLNSNGDSAVTFPIVGITFLVLGVIFTSIELYKQKERKKLITRGIKIQGIATKIKRSQYIRVGKKTRERKNYPYIIYFNYEYSGRKYDGESRLIWDKPIISRGETITVWIDEYKRQHYFVEV